MGKIEELAAEFEKHICVPWRRTVAGAQRVVMVVYPKEHERTLRARIAEFEQRTRAAGHDWFRYDVTRSFAEWVGEMEYRDAYFENPEDLPLGHSDAFTNRVVEPLRALLREAGDDDVVALTGVGSLYGFVRVSEVIRAVEPDISGRLVVFFPGSRDGNTYRLLDARDGWNYLAHSITLHGVGG